VGLNTLYTSGNIIKVIELRRIKWAGNIARMVDMRNAYNILVGKPDGMRPLAKPRRRCEDNIRMDLR
jgi:hypothetical protein